MQKLLSLNDQVIVITTGRGLQQWSDLSQLFRRYILHGSLMRFYVVPHFDHNELGWIIVGLMDGNGLTSLRRIDAWNNGN
jgi:hypothetical protein